ncbi:MAG: hypothetical protein V7L14_04310 [Nostoc sp.]|uniref:hypothetical protein n=1 Tax=unclassified Nostoc TaxID=2593658 RepID=UPI0025DFC4F7|nr:hypothetical protein [Nostoc sp. NOS(2021)]MBN3897738.1 hypothetical protein [Nostoc sp. NOS(2021)]
MKEFAEDAKKHSEFNLLNYITQEFISCGVEQESTKILLAEGKLLILLDGLDEVPAQKVVNNSKFKMTLSTRR